MRALIAVEWIARRGELQSSGGIDDSLHRALFVRTRTCNVFVEVASQNVRTMPLGRQKDVYEEIGNRTRLGCSTWSAFWVVERFEVDRKGMQRFVVSGDRDFRFKQIPR